MSLLVIRPAISVGSLLVAITSVHNSSPTAAAKTSEPTSERLTSRA